MQSHHRIAEKTEKTTKLLGIVNLVISPVMLIDKKVGLLTLLAVNSWLLYSLHEYGKSRRPGGNLAATLNRFFIAPPSEGDAIFIENTFRNIINGGASVYETSNEAIDVIKDHMSYYPR